MRNAMPRTLKQMQNRATRYEIVVRRNKKVHARVAFTSRTSRRSLLSAIQANADAVRGLPGVADDVEVAFIKDGAGRWWAHLQDTPWLIGFTGRTERDVHAALAGA